MATTEIAPGVDAQIARAFDDAPAVIAIHRGPDHRFVFVNRRFLESSDGRPLVGRNYAEAFPEFVEQGYLDIFNNAWRTGDPFVATGVRADTPRKPGGPAEERYWNLIFQPNRDERGAVEGITSFAFEVTEHVLARRAAEAAEHRYNELVRALGVVVWCAEPTEWRALWVRGDTSQAVGVPPESFTTGAGVASLLSSGDRESLARARAELREEGDAYRLELRLETPGGEERWVVESAQLHREPGTDRLLAYGLVQDFTERAQAQRERDRLQAQLLHVQKLESLGMLAGGIAHDFNNLLTAILGNASLAEMQLSPGHPAARSVASMVTAARRASDLTRQLLAFSGRGHFRVESTDINERLRELAILLEATVPKKVSLRLEAAGALPPVECDVSQLNQVLMNLVINGAEAIGDEGGTVVIRTASVNLEVADLAARASAGGVSPGTFAVVEVSDTGRGMDPDTVSRIFDPFFTTKPTGHGLGLAAVQGIVRGHRGFITVYSEVGRGTTFKVFLPTVPAPDDPGKPGRVASGQPGRTVLVVDDEPAVREFARAALEHGGYRVVEAVDGVAAVETFRALAADIDVVLLDLTMPRMNGEEALREIRRLRPTTPVVLSSGYNEVEATRRLVGRGRIEFIQKPYSVAELLKLLSTVLEK